MTITHVMAGISILARPPPGCQAKSTVLQPLTWLLGMLLAAVIGAAYVMVPAWMVVVLLSFSVVVIVLFLSVYVYCLFVNGGKNADLLRSETYSIQKMAIEKGVYGDSTMGSFSAEDTALALLNAPAMKQEKS